MMAVTPYPNTINRRRFLTISAGALGAGLLSAGTVHAALPLHRWRGIALGADAEIRLYHPDAAMAEKLLGAARAEIRRLEAVFSLYRDDSALSRLNRDGRLAAPPLDLVELLGLSGRVHKASGGAFDPSIQPLWRLYADAFTSLETAETGPAPAQVEAVRAKTGFRHVRVAADEIRFARDGMALTLNGIAQGFITDRVGALLRDGGMDDILVNLGEIRGYGSDAAGDGWRVGLDPDHSADGAIERIRLRDMAVASSACLGTTFDAGGRVGHILDPRTGKPGKSGLSGVSVVAGSAALADGLSTAALVCDRDALAQALRAFPGTSARLVGEDGVSRWLTPMAL